MTNELHKKIKFLVTISLTACFVFAPVLNVKGLELSNTLEIKLEETDKNIYDLLIIAPKNFENELKPLVNHKNSYGIKTKLVSLSDVYDETFWLGRDQAEKVKYFIKNSIENWGIKYVLLVGSFNKMPVRYVYNDESGFPEPCYLSDLYFADIYDSEGNFSSWDTNNNDIFGEWKGNQAQDKDIDLRPDVYVGRLACRSVSEVKVMVDKIIKYETTTYNSPWFKRIAAVAGDTYPDGQYDFPTPAMEGEENAKLIFENITGFEQIELFTSTGNFTGPQDIVKVFKEGVGFFVFDGHGNPFRWSTHPPNNHTWIKGLSVLIMNLLYNKDKYPIVICGGCHNGQFDVHFSNIFKEPWYYYTWISQCWAWKLIHKINGGSIATIANTGLGMSKEDKESGQGAGDYMDIQFFYEYGTNGTKILGECWGKAINRYLNRFPIDWNTPSSWDYAYDVKTVQQWVLFGDPRLMIGGYPALEE
ncbi:MAG: C25 family cysteine peptidase [Candidatus Thermoplasmatota archaeon]|nr:C25 family cysteine peptidase [Candidatus Thermoplasmatota archaeon]